MLKALPATWGDPPYELKRRKGATPLAKGPRHTSVMALPTLPGSLDMTVWSSVYGGYFSRWTSFIIKIFIGRRLQASSQLTSLRGVVCQIRFKTDAESEIAAVAKKILFWIVPFHGFCTFGSGTPNSVVLGDSRRSACSAARLTS